MVSIVYWRVDNHDIFHHAVVGHSIFGKPNRHLPLSPRFSSYNRLHDNTVFTSSTSSALVNKWCELWRNSSETRIVHLFKNTSYFLVQRNASHPFIEYYTNRKVGHILSCHIFTHTIHRFLVGIENYLYTLLQPILQLLENKLVLLKIKILK